MAVIKSKWSWLAIIVVFGALVPIISSAYLLNLATLVLVFGTFAASVNLLGGFAGMVTLGQAGTFAAAGYAVAYMSTHSYGSYLDQILAALGVAFIVSAIFGAMAVRTTGVYFLMVTLAQGMIIWGLAYSLSSITGGENGLPNVARPSVIDGPEAYYYACLFITVLVLLGMSVFVKSAFGLSLRAIQSNEGRAKAVGYNTTLHRFLAFVVAGVLAGVSGVMFVYAQEFISPSAAYFQMSADGMVMALIGGLGSIFGPIIGSVVLVFITNVLSASITRWPTVEGIIFILIVLYARHGLIGIAKDAWAKFENRRLSTPRSGIQPRDESRAAIQVASKELEDDVISTSAVVGEADDNRGDDAR